MSEIAPEAPYSYTRANGQIETASSVAEARRICPVLGAVSLEAAELLLSLRPDQTLEHTTQNADSDPTVEIDVLPRASTVTSTEAQKRIIPKASKHDGAPSPADRAAIGQVISVVTAPLSTERLVAVTNDEPLYSELAELAAPIATVTVSHESLHNVKPNLATTLKTTVTPDHQTLTADQTTIEPTTVLIHQPDSMSDSIFEAPVEPVLPVHLPAVNTSLESLLQPKVIPTVELPELLLATPEHILESKTTEDKIRLVEPRLMHATTDYETVTDPIEHLDLYNPTPIDAVNAFIEIITPLSTLDAAGEQNNDRADLRDNDLPSAILAIGETLQAPLQQQNPELQTIVTHIMAEVAAMQSEPFEVLGELSDTTDSDEPLAIPVEQLLDELDLISNSEVKKLTASFIVETLKTRVAQAIEAEDIKMYDTGMHEAKSPLQAVHQFTSKLHIDVRRLLGAKAIFAVQLLAG